MWLIDSALYIVPYKQCQVPVGLQQCHCATNLFTSHFVQLCGLKCYYYGYAKNVVMPYDIIFTHTQQLSPRVGR